MLWFTQTVLEGEIIKQTIISVIKLCYKIIRKILKTDTSQKVRNSTKPPNNAYRIQGLYNTIKDQIVQTVENSRVFLVCFLALSES